MIVLLPKANHAVWSDSDVFDLFADLGDSEGVFLLLFFINRETEDYELVSLFL